MAGYAIAHVAVSNDAKFQEYVDKMPALFERYQGRLIARDENPISIEGEAWPGTVVLIEFPSADDAKAFYADADYLVAKALRAGVADLHVSVVAGLDAAADAQP